MRSSGQRALTLVVLREPADQEPLLADVVSRGADPELAGPRSGRGDADQRVPIHTVLPRSRAPLQCRGGEKLSVNGRTCLEHDLPHFAVVLERGGVYGCHFRVRAGVDPLSKLEPLPPAELRSTLPY